MWTWEPAAACGAGARLLHDDWRREGYRQASRSDLFDAGAGRGRCPRTPGREKLGGTAEQGYLHCGPNGAGHFVKMVHNGIEYGLMAAYAEGLGILRAANVGKAAARVDAETTPLRDPEHYQYDLNLRDITEVWRRGSVIASWLLDLTAASLVKDPALSPSSPAVSRIPARAAGRSRPPSTRPCRCRFSPPRFTSASARAARRIIRTSCSRRCASASADTWRKQPASSRCEKRRFPMSDSHPTHWSSSAPPAIWPTRRSSRRCRR
jgi:hypothetical protein